MLSVYRYSLRKTIPIKLSSISSCRPLAASAAYSSAAGEDPDLLHRSLVPTLYFQRSLPRLPVPKLEDTCRRYLASQQPLLTDTQYAHTEAVVNAFRDGEGQDLHNTLVASDKQNKHTSYISAPWFDMYLKDRRSLVLNHNPFMAFNDDPRPEYNSQVLRAANMVASSVRFMKTLRAGVLEPEVFHLDPKKSDNDKFRRFIRRVPESLAWYGAYWYKAFPLDMSQYGRLYNSTRIPRDGRDELFTDTSGRHVTVMRNGNIYAVDVIDQSGGLIPAEEILAHLQYILADPVGPAEHPVGIMTAADRDSWTDVRTRLVAAGNTNQLKTIDSSLFMLCLDDLVSEDPITVSRTFLHSDGANRWFDKCFSLILLGDGKACVNFEHSWGDGVAVLRYFNEVFKDTTEKAQLHPDSSPTKVDSSAAVTRLEWELTEDLKATITDTQSKFKATTASLDLNFIQYDKMGRGTLKEHKLSPDSFLQLAIQMAYYRQFGRTVATYESCSTAAFKHGRTETIRPATMATRRACQLFCEGGASVADLRASLDDCSAMHSELTKQAAMGQGFDRHLFALRTLASQEGDVPDIFQDPAYASINANILSTSTLSSPAVRIGGFGAVVPDGYGVGYAVEKDFLGMVVTNYPEHKTNVSDFLQCATDSLDAMKSVLEGNSPKN